MGHGFVDRAFPPNIDLDRGGTIAPVQGREGDPRNVDIVQIESLVAVPRGRWHGKTDLEDAISPINHHQVGVVSSG